MLGRPGGPATTSSTPTSTCARRPTAARPGRRMSAARSAAAAFTPTSTGWTGTRRRWTATRRRAPASSSATTPAFTARTADGVNGTWVKADEQPWNQTYHLAISHAGPERRMTMGLQDNGSVRTWTSQTNRVADRPEDLHNWNSHGGGDGHWNVIDPVDQTATTTRARSPRAAAATAAGATATPPRQSRDGGQRHARSRRPGSRATSATRPTRRSIIDPNDTRVIYIGGTTIGRNTEPRHRRVHDDQPVMRRGRRPEDDRAAGPRAAGRAGHRPVRQPVRRGHGARAGQVADAGAVRADDLRRHRHRPGVEDDQRGCATPTWTRMQGLPERWVNYIIVDPDDTNHAYVAFSGFREGDDAANVYETKDGTTWTNISRTCPTGRSSDRVQRRRPTSCSRPPTSASSTTRTAIRTGTRSASACRRCRCSTSSSTPTASRCTRRRSGAASGSSRCAPTPLTAAARAVAAASRRRWR